MLKLLGVFALILMSLGSVAARAADGVVIIDQATVLASGGFPYVINAPGSYRLESNLTAKASDGIHIVNGDVQLGDGDSGGPVLLQVGGVWDLAGLADRRFWTGDLADYRRGIYWQVTYQVRISHYAGWIDSAMTARK